ncbi:ScpA family protein [Acidithiobacillus sp.]|uniref:segregation and condensation protein A n=1 Tax=Acidithiobacillus sp. TaxID=1872118 RepID=UPI00261A860C|nr:ScpA family protein [Acidithiobacillus sp.]MDD2750148.1 ScpA family protein [Acidithiobacillus sp.]MDD5278277.1 ScpA family protein [Acidithiobacillus sp.]
MTVVNAGMGQTLRVNGQPLDTLPEGLFIPPDALEVLLDSFSGPLELLLWLIRRNRMDIRDIPVAEVTRQYLQYLQEARRRNLELAAEYLLMAAWLAEIKARMLLPVPPVCEDEEMDPRLELVRRLEALALVQSQSEILQSLPQSGRDFWSVNPVPYAALSPSPPLLELGDIAAAWLRIQQRPERRDQPVHQLSNPAMGLRQRMVEVLLCCRRDHRPWQLLELLPELSRQALSISLLAILELLRQEALQLLEDSAGGWQVRIAGMEAPQHA